MDLNWAEDSKTCHSTWKGTLGIFSKLRSANQTGNENQCFPIERCLLSNTNAINYCAVPRVETLQEKETKSEVKDEQGCDLIRSCPVNIWCVLKWGIRTAILVGIMIYQWIHGHPFSDKLIYRYDTCSWTSISHVSRTIHIQVLMVESGRVAQLPMLKFCRDFVAGEEKQKGQEREAFSRQLFQSFKENNDVFIYFWLRRNQWVHTNHHFLCVFFSSFHDFLAKNSSLAELASSFAELETWAQDIHVDWEWLENALRMGWWMIIIQFMGICIII